MRLNILHGHDGVGLGLDLGDTLDALELGDEGLLGLELGLLPLTEGIGGQGDNNLEVEASTADNALHVFTPKKLQQPMVRQQQPFKRTFFPNILFFFPTCRALFAWLLHAAHCLRWMPRLQGCLLGHSEKEKYLNAVRKRREYLDAVIIDKYGLGQSCILKSGQQSPA
jgi:hypothetical protein